jgi:hypothetical protein
MKDEFERSTRKGQWSTSIWTAILASAGTEENAKNFSLARWSRGQDVNPSSHHVHKISCPTNQWIQFTPTYPIYLISILILFYNCNYGHPNIKISNSALIYHGKLSAQVKDCGIAIRFLFQLQMSKHAVMSVS